MAFNRRAHFENAENTPSNPEVRSPIGEIIERRFSRRGFLKGAGSAGLGAAAIGAMNPLAAAIAAEGGNLDRFAFDEIPHGVDTTHHVAPGHDAEVLIRWGDPLFADAPAFDPHNQHADAQERQFGYNNDYVGFVPLAGRLDRGLLVVNHEFTNEELMFPGLPGPQDEHDFSGITAEMTEIEKAAHGLSVVEIRRENGRWSYVQDSRYNRRITPRSTEIAIGGPVAGHARVRTDADPEGRRVIGTLNNCAGGMTPWGTILTCEENFHGYFLGDATHHPEKDKLARYGVPGASYSWGRHDARFDITREPNEPNRFGWVVEIDPLDPASTPVKRTALGRIKHEGAATLVAEDGRLVVYMGDDQRFDYVYKFVSRDVVNTAEPAANRDLLDDGTLYVARFDAGGRVTWLPLVHGEGPLTAENGFASQADVLIDTRLAADALGATPMDRPEDIAANPVTGDVYVMLTNNHKRGEDQVDAANPRAENLFGHVLEIITEGRHTATENRWDILVRCGDPSQGEVGTMWNPATSENGWFASPDNCVVDARGRLWVTTDQGGKWPKSGTADGVWALETEGERRGTGKMFFRVPVGAEMCGPCFTPDDTALFVAVQHPAADGAEAFPGHSGRSSFETPATRWPDFEEGVPPRPSVVAITRHGGGTVG
ncbi:PhoX family protein [Halomonas sp. M4R1S46]|uniref:PhoX family protein n=1 Tax=Halomonas sp. M4R1S46 TaxID=2982692 RepID=UPI0021E3AEFE|nr:PhoX family phosphatase [Halomonas sp. M4R1S46]UYG07208.1 PhoX family phosphatase [Halomonas sp. M4R1S46]